MSDHEPLDPSLAKLFRDEPSPAPSPDAQARVLERLALSIPASVGHVPSPLTGPATVGAKAVTAIAAAFVVGGIVGGFAVAVLRPSPPARVVYVDRPVLPTPSVPVPTPSTAPVSNPTIAPSPLPDPRSAAPSIADPLSAERDLIEDARSKLTNGDAPSALTRLQDHARRYPHGQLAEEREALTVEALVQTGHYDAARSRASRMRARWPNSVFLPAVDATLESIP